MQIHAVFWVDSATRDTHVLHLAFLVQVTFSSACLCLSSLRALFSHCKDSLHALSSFFRDLHCTFFPCCRFPTVNHFKFSLDFIFLSLCFHFLSWSKHQFQPFWFLIWFSSLSLIAHSFHYSCRSKKVMLAIQLSRKEFLLKTQAITFLLCSFASSWSPTFLKSRLESRWRDLCFHNWQSF